MGLPTLPAAHVVTAADLAAILAWIAPPTVRKSQDEPRFSNTTLTADSELLVPVAANSTYHVWAHIIYLSGTTPDFKVGFSIPTGATLDPMGFLGHAGGAVVYGVTAAGGANAGLDGTGSNAGYDTWGELVVGNTAGTLAFQWAQNTSDPGNTIVKAGSYLMLRQVA